MEKPACIKVCIDPNCEAVFHNTPDDVKHCPDCGMRLVKIDHKTYQEKFANTSYFQYNYNSLHIKYNRS